MSIRIRKALDELRNDLESLYDDLEEANITETKFKEQVI
jgi:predicted  nucleic acid-binding Zn-ribbon protein